MSSFYKKMLLAASAAAGLLLAASPAHAVYNIVFAQTGGNVVATGSGTINTTGLTIQGIPMSGGAGSTHPSAAELGTGSGAYEQYIPLVSGPSNIGTAYPSSYSYISASSQSGDYVGFWSGYIFIKSGYLSGTALSSTTTWNSSTLGTTLGLSVGTYTWTLPHDTVVVTVLSPNVAPTFVSAGAGSLTVAQAASAIDIKGLLHVSDSDSSQTETWSQSAAPSHGTLSFTTATASSGSSDIAPGGTITYTPTASYVGADSFTAQVSDGTESATRVINVTVGSARTVAINALTLDSMTVSTALVSQSFTGAGGYGSYTYSVSAGSLPAGLSLSTGGVLTGTPSAAGAYNFTVRATDSSTGSGPYSGALAFSGTVAAAPSPVVAPPSNPIPTVIHPPPVAGVGGSQLTPLDLNSGDGPAMTNCLRDILRSVMGANAVYQGQTADGGARIGQTGLVVSFYALNATASTNNGLGQGPGIYLRGSNPLNVVTSCGTFTTTPAVYNLTEWGAFLNGMGLSAQFNAQGVMTVVASGTTYVARPDYSVTQSAPGAPRLITGSDGLMRFTDSVGNTQILYPAFIDAETLSNQVAQAVGGYTVIQTDGTALVTLWGGQKYVLTPDMTLGTVPPEQFAAGWWQDGPNHYRYRNSSFSATSQGFTVKPL
jgi:hypothetical protein